MADVPKNLGQHAASAAVEELLYSPSGVVAVTSTILVINRGSTDATFRLIHRLSGELTTTNKNYFAYDLTVPANDVFPWTIGKCLSDGDELRVYASNANLTFQVDGLERTLA